jgi:methionyl-tRNA synthetase
MAKDIIKTHCIYWPIMLKALGLDPPASYLVHGYWVGEGGRKMSKSLGNAVDPQELRGLVGTDGIRYYLLKNMTSGDSTVSTALIVQTYNADLANTIGNLFARVLRFSRATGTVPDPASLHPDDDRALRDCVGIATEVLATAGFETLQLLPRGVLDIGMRLNAHVDAVAPWRLAREPEQQARLDSAIYALLEGLRVLAELAWPVMPGTSDRALRAVGGSPISGARAHRFVPFALPRGGPIGGIQGPLFPRV